MFRDCAISGQDDCNGSGRIAGSVFTSVLSGRVVGVVFTRTLSDKTAMDSTLVARAGGPDDELSDEAAVTYARGMGYEYVVNGEVLDFFRVPRYTFRTQRAGVSVRVLRTSDGQVIVSSTKYSARISLAGPPETLLKNLAQDLRDKLEDDD